MIDDDDIITAGPALQEEASDDCVLGSSVAPPECVEADVPVRRHADLPRDGISSANAVSVAVFFDAGVEGAPVFAQGQGLDDDDVAGGFSVEVQPEEVDEETHGPKRRRRELPGEGSFHAWVLADPPPLPEHVHIDELAMAPEVARLRSVVCLAHCKWSVVAASEQTDEEHTQVAVGGKSRSRGLPPWGYVQYRL